MTESPAISLTDKKTHSSEAISTGDSPSASHPAGAIEATSSGVLDSWNVGDSRQRIAAQALGFVACQPWQEILLSSHDIRPTLERRPASQPAIGGLLNSSSLIPGGKKRSVPNEFTKANAKIEADSKRLRTRPRPEKIHDFPELAKPTRPNQVAVSPLFFSHSPRQRPTLPRFSSSDAGATMMEKATMEDNSSNVRTVKLARGSISDMSPHTATSTASRRQPGGRLPGERQDFSKILSPDERELTSRSLRSLSQVGILELLEQDDRLAFIVDLENTLNFHAGPIHVAYANATLKAYSSILNMIRGRVPEDTTGLTGAVGFPEFKAWVMSFVQNGEAMDVSLPAFAFGGALWTCSTLRKKFRIFYGVVSTGAVSIRSNPPTTAPSIMSSAASNPSNHSHVVTESAKVLASEPSDYFGDVQSSTVSSLLGEPAEGVLSSIETPATTNKQSLVSSTKPIDDTSLLSLSSTAIGAKASNKPQMGEPASRNPSTEASDPSIIQDQGFFDWTRLPVTAAMPKHIQFARSIEWAKTSLGAIDNWSPILRSTCNLLMASPHPAAMYWGEDNVALYNEPYILLAGQKHPQLMGQTYQEAWGEIWEEVKESFTAARLTGLSTMKDDDCLFVSRSGFLEETYFSWSLIPLVGPDGSVVGLFNPAFEKTRRKIAERRMLTLREVGETTAVAREVKSFWPQVLKGLEYNEYDLPFVLLYSVADDGDSDASSMHSNSIVGAKSCVLEGTLPEIPEGHPIAPPIIDLKNGTEGFGIAFREAMMADKPVLLETSSGTLDQEILEGLSCRGFPEKPRAAIVCPIHPATGDSINGFLVMGVNPRRSYDDDYSLFVQLLSRQLTTSLASVALFEEEIKRGQRAAKLAALDRIELSEQLAARTKEAVESETKFTRMAELAPVGIFIADREGRMIFTNDTFHALSKHPKGRNGSSWMDTVKDEDREVVREMWEGLIQKKIPMTTEFRFKTLWEDPNGARGDTWVLGSTYPEKDDDGNLKSAFGSITNISQQKWAQDFQKKQMEEAVELKRQQSNFIDMTSHEMRNPLSAILQCADEISGSLLEFKANSGSLQIPDSLIDSNIDAAQTIALCANHQTRIVSDVLTLSKLDSALLLVTPVDVQPTGIVQQALKMFEGELHTADIKMEFKIDRSIEDLQINWVRLDPSRLLQVLINLTTNAIKFTTSQAKRTIVITLSASTETPSQLSSGGVSYIPSRSKRAEVTEGKDWGTGDNVFLSFAVQDTGKGLTESEKKLLFLRFSQASPKTHVQYGGSGLGLFISRQLVELQGGEIGVSSENGKGSTFAFYIKARKSHGPAEAVDHVSPAGAIRKHSLPRSLKQPNIIRPSISNEQLSVATTPRPLEQFRILIVEDNLVNQRVLSKQLRAQGCVVTVANHGGECIEELKQTRFWTGHETNGTELNIILMDLEMPVMDGLTCTRTIRELQRIGVVVKHVPIIAVSANARNAHIESALAAGMDDVVSKPFRIPELIPKIQQLVQD